MSVPVCEWSLAIVAEHESYRLAVEEDCCVGADFALSPTGILLLSCVLDSGRLQVAKSTILA